MALTYDEGMSALRAMFPTWDTDALAELLEANAGHLENTIDMMLTMETPVREDNESVATAHASSPSSHAAAASARPYALDTSDYDEEDKHNAHYAASPAPTYRKSPRSSPQRKATTTSSKRRLLLPDDFLRLPLDASYDHHELSAQEQRDAALAEMLQNEIFRHELFANDEFATHFVTSDSRTEQRRQPAMSAADAFDRSTRAQAAAYPDKSATELATETLTAMSVKFASMSETMKKRASEMYMRFQTRADAQAQTDPYSHRPLMADDSSDDEDVSSNTNSSAGKHVRQRHMDAPPTAATGPSVGRRSTNTTSTYTNKKNE